MPKKEGFSLGEELAPEGLERLVQHVAAATRSLEEYFGPDVVDSGVRRQQMHQEVAAREEARLRSGRATPEKLAAYRQREFGLTPTSVSPAPLTGVVDIPNSPFPAIHSSQNGDLASYDPVAGAERILASQEVSTAEQPMARPMLAPEPPMSAQQQSEFELAR